MKKIKTKLLISMCIFLTFMVGCKKEHLNDNEESYQETKESAGKPIILGNKLNNAYSIENMTQAYRTIKSNQALSRNTNSLVLPDSITMQQILVSNAKYIRVLPRNDEDFDSLREAYDTIDFSDFPLNYNITQYGNYYQDPTLPDTQITWQYAVLKKTENISTYFQQEVLNDNIFLPENSPYFEQFPQSFWDNLEATALQIAGQGDLVVNPSDPSAGRYRPNGNIQALDDQLRQNIGLEGAKVMAFTGWRRSKAYTDINGNFSGNHRFITKCEYFIKWESDNHRGRKYDIRSGFYGQAWTFLQARSFNACHVIIDRNFRPNYTNLQADGIHLFYASIHRGIYDVYFHDPFGLSNPRVRIKIGAKNSVGTGVNHHIASIVAGPDIKIWRYETSTCEKSTLRIYGTTVHEVGHSIQRSLGIAKFAFCSNLVRESWADCVEWCFVMHKYNAPNSIYSNNTRFEVIGTCTNSSKFMEEYPFANFANYDWNHPDDSKRDRAYSALFIDIIDNSSENTTWRKWRVDANGNAIVERTGQFGDKVSHYTLKEIENCLANKDWSISWKANLDHIKSWLYLNSTNNTKYQLAPYLDFYYNNYEGN